MNIIKKIMSIFGKVITAFLIVIMLIILITRLSGNTPNLFGYSFYRIATDSMTPSLEVGDLIITKKVKDFSSLELEDVITYNCEKGRLAGMSITHRIIEINNENGSYSFITQGTKEGATVDEYPVLEHQIDGVMVCKVAFIGKVVGFVTQPYVFFIIIIVPLVVCLFFETRKLFIICKTKEEPNEEISNKENI